jgi:hypothetical protein
MPSESNYPIADWQVPPFSQRIPDEEAGDLGWSPELAEFWQKRCCGIVGVQMLMACFAKPPPAVTVLIHEGLELDGYCTAGWKHVVLAELLRRAGIEAGVGAGLRDGDLVKQLQSGPLLASVRHGLNFRSGDTSLRSGHLVLLTGYDPNTDRFRVHHPSHDIQLERFNVEVPREDFVNCWSGRIVWTIRSLAVTLGASSSGPDGGRGPRGSPAQHRLGLYPP